jgi:cytochrome c oxidase subunit 1
MMIAVPSGVQIFCWIASLWRGRPRFATPLLFVVGFIVIFVLGGLSARETTSSPRCDGRAQVCTTRSVCRT